ncbi:MAG: hypothetical protein JXA13_14545 [Anaerolineales bacterium]|nr:hypothetical protein [Anaerolineales bacterium]
MNLFVKGYGKVVALLLTMILGALFPRFHSLSFLIQYLLMIMLFFAFLEIEFKNDSFKTNIFWILVANLAVAFISYAVLLPFDITLALAAFMTAIAPTAIAAPVVISFIRGNIGYVVTAVLVTNIANAVVIPLVLPLLLSTKHEISIWGVLGPVLIVMFVPLILACLVSAFLPRIKGFLRKGKPLSFLIWLINLLIISANASNFLRNDHSDSLAYLLLIALISMMICSVNFGLGALLGGRISWRESSQALGQKNLSFVIWIALTFINPLVAMGPMFYILFHHLYNSWLIYRFEKQQVV